MGISKSEHPWVGVTSPRLLPWAAARSQSWGTGQGWSWHRRMFLPCASGAGLAGVWCQGGSSCKEKEQVIIVGAAGPHPETSTCPLHWRNLVGSSGTA